MTRQTAGAIALSLLTRAITENPRVQDFGDSDTGVYLEATMTGSLEQVASHLGIDTALLKEFLLVLREPDRLVS